MLRTLCRRQELAVRVALGGGRGRLLRQLRVQSLLFAALAVAVAFPVAWLGVQWQAGVLKASQNGPPHWLRFEIDGTVIALALGAGLLTALATGLLPALRAARDSIADTLRDGS